ncbi:hypothetical protein LGN17_21405 [Burkholderia sp. AU30280]|uniref:hypothetical protein n=1 Tax=Burkholderia sp. AU30280 TaxID=2879628 RepID=UPI001CF4DC27|nr:hypothetical protein [Burkholderia sp. AU30280]MCA8275046.1 hypothetical protein [Burkholderia sp. AU30280]
MGRRIVPEPIFLTDEQFAYLNEKYPSSGAKASNHTTGDRAAYIARLFLEDLYPGCTFVPQAPGADLAIRDPYINVEDQMDFEVKGTSGNSVAIPNIVASSKDSGNLLEIEGVPILRITGVFQKVPGVAVLVHGEDFVLKHEYRKRAKAL